MNNSTHQENRMNLLKTALAVFSVTCLLVISCKKYEEPFSKPRLFITLKDDSAKAVAGATVRLYKNAQDPGIVLISDTSGIVLFENLEPALYYWHAEKGCSTNRVSQTTLNRPLINNVVLYGYSVMTETGILKITNTSTEPYKVSDTLVSTTVYIDTPYIAYRKVRSYLIHSEKISTPGVGKDSLLMVNCGDTTRLILPY
jgi:hypothetical protein